MGYFYNLIFILFISYFLMPQFVLRKWLLSLPVMIYAIVMIFVADGVRLEFGAGNLLYAVLNTSVGLAATFVLLIPVVDGAFRFCLLRFVADKATRSGIVDVVYWFVAGLAVPFVLLFMQTFAGYSGTVLMPTLMGMAIAGLCVFIFLRRRGWRHSPLLLLPAVALAMPIMLGISLFYGMKVSAAAVPLARGAHYCIISTGRETISVLDLSPLTLLSRGLFEYHAELIVETTPKPSIYNWSWSNLAFTPVKPDMCLDRSCFKQ